MPSDAPPAKLDSTRAGTTMLATAFAVMALVLLSVIWVNTIVDHNAKDFGIKRDPDRRWILVKEMHDRADWTCSHDSVILGSSRVRTVGHFTAGDHKFYSLTAPGLVPREFSAYLEDWVRLCGREPEIVIVGLDFYGASLEPFVPGLPAERYMQRRVALTEWLGIYETLSKSRTRESVEVLLSAKRSRALRSCIALELRRLSRGRLADFAKVAPMRIVHGRCLEPKEEKEAIATVYEPPPGEPATRNLPERRLDQVCLRYRLDVARDEQIAVARIPAKASEVRHYKRYYRDFDYDPKFRESLTRLRAAYPRTEFIALVTPVTNVFTGIMVDAKRLPEYRRFLEDAVASFDTVWQFGGLNRVTVLRSNFVDENHLIPIVADLMIAKVLNVDGVRDDPDAPSPYASPADFGEKLTAQTLAAYFERLERLAKRPKLPATKRERSQPNVVDYALVSSRRSASFEDAHDCGLTVPPGNKGLTIRLPSKRHDEVFETALESRVAYRIAFLKGNSEVGHLMIPVVQKAPKGLYTRSFEVPQRAVKPGYDAISVRMVEGKPERAGIGHLILSPDADDP